MTLPPAVPPESTSIEQPFDGAFSPAEIWATALKNLAQRIAGVDFETWVQATHLLAYGEGVFTAACINRFGRDWLNENAVPVMESFLMQKTARPTRVIFVVDDGVGSLNQERKPSPVIPPGMDTLESRMLAPERIVRFPLYLLRWLPYVGAQAVFVAAALRQEVYLAGGESQSKDEKTVSARGERVCRWAGVSRAQFFRLNQPGSGLEWLVEKQETGYAADPVSGKRKKLPNRYRLYEDVLTPGDAQRLGDYLVDHGIEDYPTAALETAFSAGRSEVFGQSFSRPPVGWEKQYVTSRTVEQVIEDLLDRALSEEEADLAGQLAGKLLRKGEFLQVSWYFLTNWLPLLGAEAGMLILLMRSLCYFDDENGEARDEVWVKGSYREIAARLGISGYRRVSYWFPDVFNKGRRKSQLTEASNREISRRKSMQALMGHFIERVNLCSGAFGRCGWKFKVSRQDPLTPADQAVLGAVARLVARAEEDGDLAALQDWTRALPGDLLRQKGPKGEFTGRLQEISSGCNETLTRLLMDCFATIKVSSRDCCETPKSTDQDWAETLLKILKIYQEILIEKETNQDTCCAGKLKSGGGFPDFSLEKLLTPAHEQVKKELLASEKGSRPLISWMLYACAQPNIANPLGFAIAKLRASPGVGAGGAASRLAGLPSEELAHLVQEAVGLSPPAHADWQMLFGQVRYTRLRMLADLLGLEII